MPAGFRLKSEELDELALHFAEEQVLLQISKFGTADVIEGVGPNAALFFRLYDAWVEELERLNSERDTGVVGFPSECG